MENPSTKRMIWGYPHFRKPPYKNICIYNGDGIASDGVDQNDDIINKEDRINPQCGYPAKIMLDSKHLNFKQQIRSSKVH